MVASVLFSFSMQAVGIASAGHESAGKGIDDHNAVFIDNIIDIALHNTVSTDCLIDMVRDLGVFDIVQILNAKELLCLACTRRGQCDMICLFIDNIIGINVIMRLFIVEFLDDQTAKLFDEAVGAVIHIGGLFASPRNDQRRSCLIDQN